MLGSMNREADAIEKDIARVVFYMNGGINFTDAYSLSSNQLRVLSDTVSEHYEKQNEAFKNANSKR